MSGMSLMGTLYVLLSFIWKWCQTNLLSNGPELAGAAVLTWLARDTNVNTSRLLKSTFDRDRRVTDSTWTRRRKMFWQDAWVHTADICFAALALNHHRRAMLDG